MLDAIWHRRWDCLALLCALFAAWWLLYAATYAGNEYQAHHYDPYEKSAVFLVSFGWTPFGAIFDFLSNRRDGVLGGITALATIAIAWFTATLWKSNQDQLMHNRRVERAYIKMGPKAPGITIDHNGRIEMKIEVRNFGTTLGRVTDFVLTSATGPKGGRLSTMPDYTRDIKVEIATAFLVANDFMTIGTYVTVPVEEAERLRRGEREMTVYGYVDYIDQFNERHRAGMGRRYDRTQPDVNLIYMVERGYNYDRVRVGGEGNDWNEQNQ